MISSSLQDIILNTELRRAKRAAHRGQTQSQYLSFGTDDDGKAEAEATNVRNFQFFLMLKKLIIKYFTLVDWLASNSLYVF